jgi:hypothetical protein
VAAGKSHIVVRGVFLDHSITYVFHCVLASTCLQSLEAPRYLLSSLSSRAF